MIQYPVACNPQHGAEFAFGPGAGHIRNPGVFLTVAADGGISLAPFDGADIGVKTVRPNLRAVLRVAVRALVAHNGWAQPRSGGPIPPAWAP